MSGGTRVTAIDLDSGESQAVTVRDDYVLIVDGACEIAYVQRSANGTVQITIKNSAPVRSDKEEGDA